MRVPELVPLPAGQQNHHHQHHHQAHHHRNARTPNSAIQTSPNPAVTAADVMTSALSEQYIFSPGAMVEAQTIHKETIVGEVLAFEYDARLLIIKSQASNNLISSSDVSCVNLDLCSKVKILAEPNPERIAADAEDDNTKLPDIDIKKLEDRLQNAIMERRMLMEAYKNGAGVEGVSLYARLHKTVGESFGISWDSDSIIIGKNIRIEKPYRANCITIRSAGPKSPPNVETSLAYAKQLVEKYWRDQQKDPFTLAPLTSGVVAVGNAAANATTAAASPSTQPPPVPQQAPVVFASIVAGTAAPAPVAASAPSVVNMTPKGVPKPSGGPNVTLHLNANTIRKPSPHSSNPNNPKQQQQQQQQPNLHANTTNHHEGPQQPPKATVAVPAAAAPPPPVRSGPTSYASMTSQSNNNSSGPSSAAARG